jgi:hypothetical protein
MSPNLSRMSRKPATHRGRILLAAVAVTGAAALAGAAAPPQVPVPHTHCVITLHGADAPTARCGAAAETGEARAGTLLMSWYRDADYDGDTVDLRSTEGPCDAAGYGVSDIGEYLGWAWNDSVSSFRTFGNCTVVQSFANNNYGGDFHTFIGDTPYVGDDWNDRISSILLHG